MKKAKEGDVAGAEKADWTTDSSGLVRRRGLAYVPPEESVRAEIMRMCHDDPTAGHLGQTKTRVLVMRKYWWPSLRQDVQSYVKSCDICQRTKAQRKRQAGEMQALPLPTKPFDSISMDFITDLPPSIQPDTAVLHDCILVIVDRYTKVGRFIPCRKTTDAPELARLFLANWFKD